MQPLTGSPRESLAIADVVALLSTDPVIEIRYGALCLDAAFQPLGELQQWMSDGSTISSDSTATIHRTCSLVIDSDAPVDYLTDFIKPWMTLSNLETGVSAKFNLGVYTMTTPDYDNSATPTALTVTGYDLLSYLNQPVGDNYAVAAGSDPIAAAVDAIAAIFPGATVVFAEQLSVLAKSMSWPALQQDPYNAQNSQVTYLNIVNDLLASVGYAPVWVDWDGNFIMQPYVTPANSEPEWAFNLQPGAKNIVGSQRTSSQDWFDVPNVWVFTMDDLDASPVEGATQFTYLDYNAANITSIPNRGGRIITRTYSITAADFASLEAAGLQQVILDLRPIEQFQLSLKPFPIAWHYDIATLDDPNIATISPQLSSRRQLLGLQWQITLDGTVDMPYTWQTATQ